MSTSLTGTHRELHWTRDARDNSSCEIMLLLCLFKVPISNDRAYWTGLPVSQSVRLSPYLSVCLYACLCLSDRNFNHVNCVNTLTLIWWLPDDMGRGHSYVQLLYVHLRFIKTKKQKQWKRILIHQQDYTYFYYNNDKLEISAMSQDLTDLQYAIP